MKEHYNTGRPWVVSKGPNGATVRNRHGMPVASMESTSETLRDLDARLIAAAPDMLEALRYALDEACRDNRNQELIDTLDAIITKATGG